MKKQLEFIGWWLLFSTSIVALALAIALLSHKAGVDRLQCGPHADVVVYHGIEQCVERVMR